MGARLADLDQRDLARLRAELGEVIAAQFAYPPFFDFRAGRTRVRPIGVAKRREIAGFVQSVIFEPIAQADVGAPEVRRFLEAVFLRYLEVNGDLARGPARRRLSSIRVEVPRAAAEVQRGLVSLSAGAPGDFGAPRPAASWESPGERPGRGEPTWELVERETELLQAALLRGGAEAAPPVGARPAAPVQPASRPGRPARRDGWADAPMDGTAPLPAQRVAASRDTGQSPFAGLETGSQSAIFGAGSGVGMSDQPTGHQPIVGLGTVTPGAARELPPDMLQLYNDYLRDLQPNAGAPAAPEPPWGTRASAAQGSYDHYGRDPALQDTVSWSPQTPYAPPPHAAAAPGDPKSDRLIFDQLRHQVDAYIRMAARSYGVRVRGSDPANALDALRRSGHVDEADLRIAEGILAIADRVCNGGTATVDDYRQAFMLYLLYHRGRIGT
jgi:hypothetical protein